jgi:hypothetical protein
VVAEDRQVTVFGECAATDPELHRLAAHGVTNGVLAAFPGSYTVVESTAHRTTVFTDPGHARPVYFTATTAGVLWGSSVLVLAALTDAQPTSVWPLLADVCLTAARRRRGITTNAAAGGPVGLVHTGGRGTRHRGHGGDCCPRLGIGEHRCSPDGRGDPDCRPDRSLRRSSRRALWGARPQSVHRPAGIAACLAVLTWLRALRLQAVAD